MKRFASMPLALAAVLFGLLATGCSTLGHANMAKAGDALEAGDPSAALKYATEALLENPKYSSPKSFLRDNTDAALDSVKKFLAATEKSTKQEDLERRFDTYGNLVKFYANLKKIGLPIAEGKKLFGLIKSWEWTTPLEDYAPQAAAARAAARAGFLKAGSEALKAGDLDGAYAAMGKAVGKFAVSASEEQKADKAKIAQEFLDWARKQHGAADAETLLKGIKAYDLALKFDPKENKAVEGQAKMKKELSAVYLKSGLRSEKAGTIESLTEAIAFFEKALKYDAENADAKAGIPRVKNSIAEAYYREGVRLSADRKSDEIMKNAIAAFENAQKWVPNYKDTEVLKNRVRVSRELAVLSAKLGASQTELGRTAKRVKVLAGKVDKANKGMDDLNYVADAVVQLDEQLLVLTKTTSALSAIPIVGTVISVTGTALGKVHTPVKSVSGKVKRVRAPFITPSREFLASTKKNTDRIVSAMAQTDTSLAYVRKVAERLNDCMAKVPDPSTVKTIEQDVKELNKAVDDLNKGLETVNTVADKSEGTLTDLADAVGPISEVTGGIKKVMTPLNKIKGVTDEIYSVLKKTIKVPLVGSFTVEQAINSTTGVVKKAAEAVLNPILKELGIGIPQIPAIEKLDNMMDKVEGYYADAKMAADQIGSAANKLTDIPSRLKSKADEIVSKSGCPL